MIPPMTGPVMPPSATVVAFRPSARPRSLVGNTDTTIAAPIPWTSAEPTPCKIRMAMSWYASVAKPASVELIVKIARPRT